MEKFRYDPRISAEATLPGIKGNWERRDIATLNGFIERIADDALSAMQNPYTALNAWQSAFYGFRHHPETVLFGNNGQASLRDFPGIVTDMSTRGQEYHAWLLRKLIKPDDAIDLRERATARTALHTLEFLHRQQSGIDITELQSNFSHIPGNYTQPTKWLSLLFNGLQLATIEVFMEEKYFDPHQKRRLHD